MIKRPYIFRQDILLLIGFSILLDSDNLGTIVH